MNNPSYRIRSLRPDETSRCATSFMRPSTCPKLWKHRLAASLTYLNCVYTLKVLEHNMAIIAWWLKSAGKW